MFFRTEKLIEKQCRIPTDLFIWLSVIATRPTYWLTPRLHDGAYFVAKWRYSRRTTPDDFRLIGIFPSAPATSHSRKNRGCRK